MNNVQQPLVTGKCEVCQQDISPGKDDAAFKRNRGLHMRMKHGVIGGWSKLHRKDPRHPNHKNPDMQPWEIGLRARLAKRLGVTSDLYPLEGLRMAIKEYSNAELQALSPEDRKLRDKIRKASWWNKHYGKNGTTPDTKERREQAKTEKSYYMQNRERILRAQKEKRDRDRMAIVPTVSSQPVETLPSVEQATQCKLNECPHCGTRFYMVRGKVE